MFPADFPSYGKFEEIEVCEYVICESRDDLVAL